MKARGWLNLALASIVCALALFAYLRPPESAPAHPLSTLSPASAYRIRIEPRGSQPIELERARAEWHLTAPIKARADGVQVQRLLDILAATSNERLAATGLARFDLEAPSERLTINDQSFSFGAVNQLSREQYVLTSDGVYLVALSYGATLPTSALQLASKQLLATDEVPVAFEFKEFSLVAHDGKWQLTPPAADASPDDINRWVDDWRLATALAVQPPGTRKPPETVKIKLKNDHLIVLGLERTPELILTRGDEELEYHFSDAAAKRLLAAPAAEAKTKSRD